MAAEWTDRTIRGPSAEYLSADELRKLFGLPAEWLEERVKEGVMPPPIRLTARTLTYTWEHAVFLMLWLKLHPSPTPAPAKGRGSDAGAGVN